MGQDQQRQLAGVIVLAERLAGRCWLVASDTDVDPAVVAELNWLSACVAHALPALQTAAGAEDPDAGGLLARYCVAINQRESRG
jgi:hypothetical protein